MSNAQRTTHNAQRSEYIPGRILALDLGERRIGVAVSDELQVAAHARGFIERRDLVGDLRSIEEWVRKEKAVRVVLGLPVHMSGGEGSGTREAVQFKALLEEVLKIPVETWDERLTTRAASALLIQADVSRKKRKKSVDSLAAVLILQNYLDSRRSRHDL